MCSRTLTPENLHSNVFLPSFFLFRMSNLLASGKLLKNRLKQVISTNIFNCFTAIGNAPQASSQSMISSYHFSQQSSFNQKSLLAPKNSILTSQTSSLHTSAPVLGRLGGAGHVKKRTATRVKQRRNHIVSRKDYSLFGN